MREDALGDRMKEYEDCFRNYIPSKSFIVIRVDGKAFHTYTKDCKRPYDDGLMDDMDATAIALCKNIQGAKFAYVQSDEISIFLTNFNDHETNTDPWFGNNIQKMVSVSASIATSAFNQARYFRYTQGQIAGEEVNCDKFKWANFDARTFLLPNIPELTNYFLWRCQDCSRNSVQMLARSLYSHAECENKNSSELQEMTFKAGTNWDSLAPKYKRGRLIGRAKEPKVVHFKGESLIVERNIWTVKELQYFDYMYWANVVFDEMHYGKETVSNENT